MTNPLGTVERRLTFLCCGLGELGDGVLLPSLLPVSSALVFSDRSANTQQLLPAAEPASVVTGLLLLLLLLSLVITGGHLSCNAVWLSRSSVKRTSDVVASFFKLSN